MVITLGYIDQAFDLIEKEIRRAVEKHGEMQTPLNREMSEREKMLIVVEEIGEIARALTYDGVNKEELTSEITQAAAMLTAWLASKL